MFLVVSILRVQLRSLLSINRRLIFSEVLIKSKKLNFIDNMLLGRSKLEFLSDAILRKDIKSSLNMLSLCLYFGPQGHCSISESMTDK